MIDCSRCRLFSALWTCEPPLLALIGARPGATLHFAGYGAIVPVLPAACLTPRPGALEPSRFSRAASTYPQERTTFILWYEPALSAERPLSTARKKGTAH